MLLILFTKPHKVIKTKWNPLLLYYKIYLLKTIIFYTRESRNAFTIYKKKLEDKR